MTTAYTPILKLALPVTGELSGTWGTVVNDNITSMVEQAVAGLATINTWTTNAHTLTTADGTTSESRCAMLVAADGAGGTALTGAGDIICPAASKLYVLKNGSSYTVTLKTSGGSGVAVPSGDTAFLFCDGTNVNACVTTIVNGHISGNLTVDGNTILGNASTDTITATAQFNTDLLPSTDNARDLGSTAKSWRTLYCDTSVLTPLVTATNLQVTNIKANDGTAAMSIADSTGAITVSTILNVDNLRLDGNTLSSTDSNGNVVIAPNGTGDVQLDADTVRVGDSAAAVTLTSNGAGALTVTTGGAADLVLNTNSGTNSGSITIGNGTNGNITVATNGTGDFYVDADTVRIGDSNANATITTNGTGDLILNTNSGTNSGSITIANGAGGNITIAPNGTGDVYLDADTVRIGDANTDVTLTTNGTGNLNLSTNSGTNSGTIQIAQGTNGNITFTPNGTGVVTAAGATAITPTARTSGAASYFTVTTPADTGQTASTEVIGSNFTAATRSWATGALTLQRERVFGAPTYAFAGASTLTTAVNVDIALPVAGTNATITNAYALRADNTLFTGNVVLNNASAALDLTNLEVTNIKAKDGTASMSIADSTGNVTVSSAFAANGGVTIGDASGDAFTINSSAVSTPNGLNFDSNTFVIDAANDRVGIGVASPVTKLHVEGSGTTSLFFVKNTSSFAGGTNFTQPHVTINSGDDTTGNVTRVAMSVGTGAQVYLDALMESGSTTYSSLLFRTRGADGVGERMRLDSSGNLGLGVTPTANYGGLQIVGPTSASLYTQQGIDVVRTGVRASGRTGIVFDSSDATYTNRMWYIANEGASGSLDIGRSGLTVLTMSNSGNLGLGVTPSAWANHYAFDIGPAGSVAAYQYTDNLTLDLTVNGYAIGLSTYRYKRDGVASRYFQQSGQHNWQTAPSGTANSTTIVSGNQYTIVTAGGNFTAFGAANNNVGTVFTATSSGTASGGAATQSIVFTQAMTLDASGNLVVGKTSGSYRFDLQGAAGENATLAGFFSGTNTNRGLTLGLSAGGGVVNDAYVVYNSTVAGGYAGHIWQAAGTERARITSGGDFGLGGISVNQTGAGSARVLTIGGTSQAFTEYVGTTGSGLATGSLHRNASALVGGIVVENATGNQGIIEFNTNNGTTYGERARITSGGYFKASNDGTYSSSGSFHEFVQTNDAPGLSIYCSNASLGTYGVAYIEAARNTTNNTFYAISYYNNGAAAYKFRVADSGAIATAGSITLGSIAPATSGIGVQFPATQSASSDANTLDDYEEGTFTPTLTFGGGSTGMTGTFNGSYTKIGDIVHIFVQIILTNKGSSTGAAIIGISIAAGNVYPAMIIDPSDGMANLVAGGATFAVLSGSSIYPVQQTTTGRSSMTDSNFTNTSDIRFFVTYKV